MSVAAPARTLPPSAGDGISPQPPPRRGRRAAIAAGAALAAAGVAAGIWAASDGEPQAGAAGAASRPEATATVERRDLVDRELVSGRLGFGDETPLTAGASGTLTRLRAEGDAVARGSWLYEVDGNRTGWLMYGFRPMWRRFVPGMDPGPDVRQLERNLRALGHDPDRAMTIDGVWTSATTRAVERFQAARGLTEDGTLERGEVVFARGPARVGAVEAAVGRPVAPGTMIGSLTGRRREVTLSLEATRQELAREGAEVSVDMPDGTAATGRIAEVGAVAQAGEQDEAPTITVRIALRGSAARGRGLDGAPVDVGFESARARDVLTVPVTALLARPGGGYAVEVVEGGRRRLVSVRPGLHGEDAVAVEGAGLRAGQEVVVPS